MSADQIGRGEMVVHHVSKQQRVCLCALQASTGTEISVSDVMFISTAHCCSLTSWHDCILPTTPSVWRAGVGRSRMSCYWKDTEAAFATLHCPSIWPEQLTAQEDLSCQINRPWHISTPSLDQAKKQVMHSHRKWVWIWNVMSKENCLFCLFVFFIRISKLSGI